MLLAHNKRVSPPPEMEMYFCRLRLIRAFCQRFSSLHTSVMCSRGTIRFQFIRFVVLDSSFACSVAHRSTSPWALAAKGWSPIHPNTPLKVPSSSTDTKSIVMPPHMKSRSCGARTACLTFSNCEHN